MKSRLLALGALVGMAAPGPVWAQEEDVPPPSLDAEAGRDEDIFGPVVTDPPVDGAVPPPVEATSIDAALDRADSTLAGGGRLWWRVAGVVPQGVKDAGDVALTAPSLLDLFVDARPNDRVRAYARARVNWDFSAVDGEVDPFTGEPVVDPELLLDQAWLKFDAAKRVFFTAGRQRVKWGVGRFWNPTDVLSASVLDPLAADDLRTGADLVRVNVPVGVSNLVAVAQLSGAESLEDVGGAARAEVVVGNTEMSVSAASRKGTNTRLGADVSTGVWVLDLRVEAAVSRGDHRWEGAFDWTTGAIPEQVDTSEMWIPQVVAGLETSVKTGVEDTITVGVEGFYNGRGQDDATLYPWLLTVAEFQPFYLGTWYGGAYATLPCPGSCDDHNFILSGLMNFSDETGIVRADWQGNVLTWLQLDAWLATHLGPVGGEFRFALEVPAIPGVAGLEDGLSVAAPRLSTGLGAQVRF